MAAGYNRKDWDELDLTKEEVENLTQAMKKEEFLKLLGEYAEEITNPESRKQYQEDIIKLEAERGVDCTFVNPEPGFVVKTSVDGKKKAFINICKNKAVGKPSYKQDFQDSTRGLNWSIPMCQAPGREDFDKKRNRCMVYDVVFHPDTLLLAEKNSQFKNLVIETALNAVEDSFKVNLDKKNLKFPKLNFKGLPFATVIRKQSSKPPVLTEEEIEFQKKIKYPFVPPKETEPVIRNFDSKKETVGKYTAPNYVIKHRSDIDLQEFTYDKTAKINAAIPKELVIEINLPLINSTKTVTLDIMEKSLHLLCEKPVKYKLDIQLPYSVNEEAGNAKFDKEKRLLIISLPVIKAKMSFADLMREDSGVESDLSPVGSVSNNEFEGVDEDNSQKIFSCVKEDEGVPEEEFKISDEENDKEKGHGTKDEVESFLDLDKQYIFPGFSCNVDDDNICFVLNVKNVDSNSVEQKLLNSHSCHIKFVSIGSGFFPVFYAFCVDFKNECDIKNVICETWDNNVTVLIKLVQNDNAVMKYYVGWNENSLVEHSLKHPLELKKIMDELVSPDEKEEENLKLQIDLADVNEVAFSLIPEESSQDDDDDNDGKDDKDNKINKNSDSSEHEASVKKERTQDKVRLLSESGIDVIMTPNPLLGKSILKKRIQRSLSESCADDYVISSSVDKSIFDGSDLSINANEDQETPHIKKTVRFNENIRQQLFRANSSILGRKKKNQKKSRNKKRALERRLSESENSDALDNEKERKARKSKNFKKNSLIKEIPNKENKENTASGSHEKKYSKSDTTTTSNRLNKNDKIFEFKSDLIFDLDM